eukprot:TRINITY_DN1920_c0_g1_i4.p1 TRINITY_DN1920_c0_g1~~TRINITY_DN1920_c0_g1_i4.p1  ORF type:complete len:194 (+),score=44.87 TRINITY_DN1920_c0_g1_i4:98-679(+)
MMGEGSSDVNPMHNTDVHFDRFIRPFLPLRERHSERLPWGGELTAEALPFFSSALLWARLPLSDDIFDAVEKPFKEYLLMWLAMLEECQPERDPSRLAANAEAQHRYMCWRAEKDPGRPVLTRLFGTERCEKLMKEFLFAGMDEMSQGRMFLDYFPQYRDSVTGGVSRRRSITGRMHSTRPWDSNGKLLVDLN